MSAARNLGQKPRGMASTRSTQMQRRQARSVTNDDAGCTKDSDGEFNPHATNKKSKCRKAGNSETSSSKTLERTKGKPKTKDTLRKEGITARKELKDVRRELEVKEAIIDELSEKIFEIQSQGKTLVLDGDQLQNQITGVQHLWRSWAIQYGVRGQVPVMKTLNHYDTVNRLLQSRSGPVVGDQTAFKTSSGASIMLQAVLVEYIDSKIFQKPYFFLSRETGGASLPILGPLDKALEGLDILLSQGQNASRVAALRAKIVEHTNPDLHSYHASSSQDPLTGRIRLSKEHYYCDQATTFIDRWSKLLICPSDKTMDIQRHNALVNIFREAGQLALRLRTQGIDLQFCHPSEPPYQRSKYESNSDLLELHSTVNVTPGSKALDNEPIQFVVEPVLVGIKPGDLEPNRRRRIYGRAVVWLRTGRDSQQSNAFTTQKIIDLSKDEPQDASTTCIASDNARTDGKCGGVPVSQIPAAIKTDAELNRSRAANKRQGSQISKDDTGSIGNKEWALARGDASNREKGASNGPYSTPENQQANLRYEKPTPNSNNAYETRQSKRDAYIKPENSGQENLKSSKLDNVVINKSDHQVLGKRKASSDRDVAATTQMYWKR